MEKVIIGVVLLISIIVINKLFFITEVDHLILQTIEQEISNTLGDNNELSIQTIK